MYKFNKNLNNNSDILENLQHLTTKFGFIDCKILNLQQLNLDKNFYERFAIAKKNFANLVEKISENILLKNGLNYLTNATTIEIRNDASLNLLLADAKYLLIFALPYVGRQSLKKYQKNSSKVALHAAGRDYHKIVRSKLKQFWLQFNQNNQKFFSQQKANYRIFCDSTPILEKFFAEISGLGWVGKNNLITNKHYGNLFVIGGIITDLDLGIYIKSSNTQETSIATNHCGTCNRCIENCPTNALQIVENKIQFVTENCLAYYLNEFKGESKEIPTEIRQQIKGKIYGCDDCITICPFNRFIPNDDFISADFADKFNNKELSELKLWNEDDFLKNSEGTGLRRLGFERWKRNLDLCE